MLVFRRVAGQQIVIAGTIRITVLKVRNKDVKLGIEAPLDIPILRGELMLPEETETISPETGEQQPHQ